MRQAQISLSSGMDQKSTFLNCEVHIHKLGQSDPSYQELQQLAFWEDMRSSAMTKQFGWSQILSCRIPKKLLPPEQIIQQWVCDLLEKDTSGVIGSFHGHLYDYAMRYTEGAFRPMVSNMNLLCTGTLFLMSSSTKWLH
jgi:hypothetical protein